MPIISAFLKYDIFLWNIYFSYCSSFYYLFRLTENHKAQQVQSNVVLYKYGKMN